MDIFQSVILGAVQGLTEFIPVSSSGHLIVLSNFFGATPTTHLFVQSLDIGTVIALIIFFRHRIADLCREVFIKHNYRLARNIIITCLPVGTIGLAGAKLIESTPFFTSSLVVAISMMLVGLLMIGLEHIPRLSDVKDGEHLSWQRALIIGLAQCVALIPGISRSGSTIATSRLMGLKPKEAAEYSFLVCIPVMIGLIGKLLLGDTSYLLANWQIVLVGNIMAFITGMIAIKYLLNYLSSHNLKAFGIYRVIVAILIMVALGVSILPR